MSKSKSLEDVIADAAREAVAALTDEQVADLLYAMWKEMKVCPEAVLVLNASTRLRARAAEPNR